MSYKMKPAGSRSKFKMSKGARKQMYNSKKKNWQIIDEEIHSLKEKSTEIDTSKIKSFEDFPLSKKTLKGLTECKYSVPTDVQRESVGLALQGQDILGAAKTGSGKTLAFIIPVLECLYMKKWSQMDGLGALIISPTRELAYQTFEVLRKVGKHHDFSAGLVIGGKPLKEEAGRINRTNIVICTPGRLLQHMDETSYFSADTLKILVLDEADRILDMGFAQTMNGILENLPPERQTLLFSATQTRSVKDLARLSLTEPVFVSVHEHSIQSTPVQLQQSYVVCELHDKLNLLWSFLKSHLKAKILVFLASCKEVKYVFEAFKRLHPGITVLALHGGMPQLKRVAAYNQFIWKQTAVLFATDIAARGLDFPSVNWVVQLDCPEDASTYIHRVGRTARYEKDGEALLVLNPSEEEGMIEQLKVKKIPISKIRINQKRLNSIQSRLESNCAAFPELKETAQRAFVSYLRSVHLMGNKKVFNVQSLDVEQFSRSLGLAIPPKVRFLKRHQKEMEMRLKTKLEKVKEKVTNKLANKTNPLKEQASLSDNSYASSDHSDSDSNDSESDNRKLVNYSQQGKSDLKQNKTEKSKMGKMKQDRSTNNESDSEDSDSESSSEEISLKIPSATAKSKHLKAKSESKEMSSDGENLEDSDDESDNSNSDNDSSIKESHSTVSVKKRKSDTGSESDSSGSEDEDNSGIDESDAKRTGSGFTFDDVKEELDDLFSVKKNVNLKEIEEISKSVEEQEVELKAGKKRKKPQSVIALAKKLKRKNLKVNTKINFDDEGEAVVDRLKAPAIDVDTERSDQVGGIDIERAKLRMREEDRVDREIYRQKIKQKHKEERLKRREANRKNKRNADDEEEAVLANDNDDSVDPIAFIPDPDKVYGKRLASDDDEDVESVPKKKKSPLKIMKKKKRLTNPDLENLLDAKNSLADDEDLALKLLNK